MSYQVKYKSIMLDERQATTTTNLPSKTPQYYAAFSASISAFSLGTALGWNSPASVKIQESLKLRSTDVAWIGSSFTVGAAAAMFPLPLLLNRFGRKRVMILLALPFAGGWSMLAFLRTLPMYCLGRFVTGFCGGSYFVALPIFLGEIAQPGIRGTLGIFFELMLVTGMSFSYTVGSFTSVTVLSVACMLWTVLFVVMFSFSPETPFYHMMKGQRDKAESSMRWYRGKDYDIDPEMREVEQFVKRSREDKIVERIGSSGRANRRSLVIGCGLIVAQQMSGIIPIAFYALQIFRESASSLRPEYSQIVMGLVKIVATAVTSVVVDRVGRKVLLVASLGGMGVCLTVMGVYFTFSDSDPRSVEDYGWVPATMLCVHIAMFSVGIGPVIWIVIGEIFPSDIKSVACSLCSFLSSAIASILVLSYPFMTNGIGKNFTFWIYALSCFLSIIFVVFFCIETMGKSLRQIQSELTHC